MNPSDAIAVLRSSGLTEAAIARAVNTTQPSINRIRRGRMSPSYDLGKALIDLAIESLRTGKVPSAPDQGAPEAA